MELDVKLGQVLSRQPKTRELNEQLSTSCRQFFTQRIKFVAAKAPDSHLEHLKSRYVPLNRAYKQPVTMETNGNDGSKVCLSEENEVAQSGEQSDGIPKPNVVLYDARQLVMGWKETRSVGCGLGNLGNTCFLNSVLQCLTYTPPLFNYVTSGQHNKRCKEIILYTTVFYTLCLTCEWSSLQVSIELK